MDVQDVPARQARVVRGRRSSGRRPWWPAPVRSRRAIFSRLRPTTSSPRPSEYQSAMSKKLMPRSSARLQDRDGRVLVQHPAFPGRASQAHGAEAKPRDLQARATEPHMIHRASSTATLRPQHGAARRRGQRRSTADGALAAARSRRRARDRERLDRHARRRAPRRARSGCPTSPSRSRWCWSSIPYRKRDSTRGYAQLVGPPAGRARRRLRPARLPRLGRFRRLLADEYLPQEQADNVAAIAWLAAQPWCNGAVGMRGVSWGGFSTLQAAALAPPALKAIMPMCASDRRYTDDAHYVGGAFALTGLKWATSFKAVMAGPPDPERVRPGLGSRLDGAAGGVARRSPPLAVHQREDDYWRQGSVGFDPAAIRCPVYLVGGWVDPYNEMIPRLLEGLQVPTKALIGPWRPRLPGARLARPRPRLGVRGGALVAPAGWRARRPGSWTGRAYGRSCPSSRPIEAAPGAIPGRWVAEPAWPPATSRRVTLRLSARPAGAGSARRACWSTAAAHVGRPGRRRSGSLRRAAPIRRSSRADDAALARLRLRSADAPLDLLGTPVLRLRIAADRPVAKLAARLCEVTPDGRSLAGHLRRAQPDPPRQPRRAAPLARARSTTSSCRST